MSKRHIHFIISFVFSVSLSAQQKITGIVEDDVTGEPVSYASVTPEKGVMIVTDSSGKFSLTIRKQSRSADSIAITAIGYLYKKISVKELLANNRIKLNREDKMLDQVRIFASLKGDERRFGYFREWKAKNEGGEIGYIFDLPDKSFQIGQVQVKINHNYDTCWLKLHLREAMEAQFSIPAKEILDRDVILPITKKFGLVEFDLGWKQVKIPNKKLYVGFELLRCGCSQSTAPSFFFMGNEEGVNFFKEARQSGWRNGGDYTIYVRMITK
ncbi:MAG TPA: hypothetical protein VFP97_11405 [Chitinophagaceae bacterium]|nr:hypothetical protein [Chitinophagaceae bacterium]